MPPAGPCDGSLPAAKPLRPTLQTCHRHVCFTLTDLHTVENTLVVGVNTGGCSLVSDNFTCCLPNSGLPVFFGTGLGFHETMENRDGVGYAPDLWVNPPDAMEAVARLCRYYGL